MIDLRSDTVTRPSDAMRQAMARAEVGDDVYGDDPTVNRLQAVAAERLGHEAALFLCSGTQSNLVALLTHCQRGDEYIVGHDAHTYKYEGGGAAALGGIQPQPVAFGDNGELSLDEVAKVIKADDVHFARTRLLCLENTQHGRVQSVAYMNRARELADTHQLSLHLDGARMANAAVAMNVSLETVAAPFDTVSLCLSKGLGAPVGSVLLGSKAFIHEATRWRKVTGGGMRQAGVLAAACLVALDRGFARLSDDHRRAQELAAHLDHLPGVTVKPGWTQTNMVWLEFEARVGDALVSHCAKHGVLMSASTYGARLVTHCDVSDEELAQAVKVIVDFFQRY